MDNKLLFEKQIALEREMEEVGARVAADFFEKAVNNSLETSASYGTTLLKNGIMRLDEAIKKYIEESQKLRGRKNEALKYLLLFADTRVVAFLALRQLLNSVTRNRPLTASALNIADMLEREYTMNTFWKTNPKLAASIAKSQTSKNEGHRFKVFSGIMKKNGVNTTKWAVNEKLLLGLKLIDLAISSTRYIDIVSVRHSDSERTVNYINVTESCMRWIESMKHTALLQPEYMPCVVKPKPWDMEAGGGYYSFILPLTLIKSYSSNIKQPYGNMPKVYDAINAVQDTAYRINTKVLTVMSALWGSDNQTYNTFPPQYIPAPICPVCGGVTTKPHSCFTDPGNKKVFLAWKSKTEKIYSENIKVTGKRLQIAKILYLADKFKDEKAIYFPHCMDFRGRFYSVPNFLEPQGHDWSKGLLEFAETKALENFAAVKWLAIHGANMFGQDKCSFDDRLLWVLENEEKIIAVSESPLMNTWWYTADKPFQFLAFCFEWAEYTAACERGELFHSRISVAMDGTCNGLQIFSLLLRDETSGRATNLLPSSKPQDVYAIVACKTIEKLRTISANGKIRMRKDGTNILFDERKMADMLLELDISRKTTKRQVMTLPYGAAFNSCKDYTFEWLVGERIKTPHLLVFKEFSSAIIPARFLAEIIWSAIQDTVCSAQSAMLFLQQCIKVMTRANIPAVWTTPLGFKVYQGYREVKSRRIRTEIGGSIVAAYIGEETPKLDTYRQKNGISPNFIHSLDACAMMETVSIAKSKGVDAFLTVHDSYATHAACAEVLALSLREAFIKLFSDDLLLRFFEETVARLPDNAREQLPALPEKGTLNITKLRESEYFFA